MSVCEGRVKGNTLQSDGTRIEECAVKAAKKATERTEHTNGLWRE